MATGVQILSWVGRAHNMELACVCERYKRVESRVLESMQKHEKEPMMCFIYL